MADQITKVDDKTVQIIKTIPPQIVTQNYDVSVIKQQIADLQALQDEFVAAQQARILTLQAILDQAASIGVVPDKTAAVAPVVGP